jgi:hypothetical protein
MATLNFLLFILFKQHFYFAVPTIVVAKLYSNTMLLILNNRIVIIGGRDEVENDHPFEKMVCNGISIIVQGKMNQSQDWGTVRKS